MLLVQNKELYCSNCSNCNFLLSVFSTTKIMNNIYNSSVVLERLIFLELAIKNDTILFDCGIIGFNYIFLLEAKIDLLVKPKCKWTDSNACFWKYVCILPNEETFR